MNIDELRDQLDYEEACRQYEPDYKDELKGALAVLGIIIAVSLLVFILGAGGNSKRVPIERVNMIELNTCYKDLEKKEVAYRQVIAYEWSPDYARFHVVGFRLVQKDAKRPINQNNGRYEFKTKEGIIVSSIFNETHTDILNDPEKLNRKLCPQKYRRGLFERKN